MQLDQLCIAQVCFNSISILSNSLVGRESTAIACASISFA